MGKVFLPGCLNVFVNYCPSLLFNVIIKTMARRNGGEVFGLAYISTSQPIIERSQDRNSSRNLEAAAEAEVLLLLADLLSWQVWCPLDIKFDTS